MKNVCSIQGQNGTKTSLFIIKITQHVKNGSPNVAAGSGGRKWWPVLAAEIGGRNWRPKLAAEIGGENERLKMNSQK